jgi:DNA-binding MarR family transcriptional regulator
MAQFTPDQVAGAILETVPPSMRAIREQMRAGRVTGMSVSQFRLLIFVRRHPGTSLTAVADHLGTTMPACSQMVDRVVRAGYVTRQQDPAERRRVELKLTDAGSTALVECDARTREWLCERLAGLTPDRLDAIATALGDVRSALSEAPAKERS